MTNTIAFNTGREYSACGQRIAARRLDCGAVVMLDIDRHVDYLFSPDTELNQRAIMRAYDNTDVIYPSDVDLSYSDYYAALVDLRAVATDVYCV